jgi:hypothetical protein
VQVHLFPLSTQPIPFPDEVCGASDARGLSQPSECCIHSRSIVTPSESLGRLMGNHRLFVPEGRLIIAVRRPTAKRVKVESWVDRADN